MEGRSCLVGPVTNKLPRGGADLPLTAFQPQLLCSSLQHLLAFVQFSGDARATNPPLASVWFDLPRADSCRSGLW